MPTYILLTTLTSQGHHRLHDEPDRTNQVNEEIEALGGRVKAQYATLGPYDFVTILEAPDNETVAVTATALAARGTIKVLALPAFPTADFLGRLKGAGKLARLP